MLIWLFLMYYSTLPKSDGPQTCFFVFVFCFSDEEWNGAELDSSNKDPLMKNICRKSAILPGIVCVDWGVREHYSLAKTIHLGV